MIYQFVLLGRRPVLMSTHVIGVPKPCTSCRPSLGHGIFIKRRNHCADKHKICDKICVSESNVRRSIDSQFRLQLLIFSALNRLLTARRHFYRNGATPSIFQTAVSQNQESKVDARIRDAQTSRWQTELSSRFQVSRRVLSSCYKRAPRGWRSCVGVDG